MPESKAKELRYEGPNYKNSLEIQHGKRRVMIKPKDWSKDKISVMLKKYPGATKYFK